ncbi:hypothetical protein BpHYR1_026677 [Brachionus plicatilis]|uniref:Uncharacterized protein n=1 Tax=Brachionus plicatilis TaxID=10195 RepID=A0A3M7Q2D7_BRAPC|nr:hypothetical protein BpHYR1_026677 [Brachionus plicatilis]
MKNLNPILSSDELIENDDVCVSEENTVRGNSLKSSGTFNPVAGLSVSVYDAEDIDFNNLESEDKIDKINQKICNVNISNEKVLNNNIQGYGAVTFEKLKII